MALPHTGRKPGAKSITEQERARIFHMWKELGYSAGKIGLEIGRSRNGVAAILAGFHPTTHMARAHFDKEAYNLAKRITDQANVDQALEVLDRTAVLEKRRDVNESGRPSVIVCVGMPGQPALTPPPQILVTRALAQQAESQADDE